MKILILCAGRRAKVVQYFRRELEETGGEVYAADMDTYAPAVHFAQMAFSVCPIDSEHYLTDILEICEKENVTAVLSLIDSELELLAQNRRQFEAVGTIPVISPLPMVEMSFDKYAMHRFLECQGVPSYPTYGSPEEAVAVIDAGKESYPLVMKPACGSASKGVRQVTWERDFLGAPADMVFQPVCRGKEYGVDVYVDLLTGELVDLFIKEKLSMRSGETDKAVSVRHEGIEELIRQLVDKTDFRGPIDIDVFERDGQVYVSEVNPRFGGGYPHAYECGVNFPRCLLNNLSGIPNSPYSGFTYEEGKVMMKFDDVVIL